MKPMGGATAAWAAFAAVAWAALAQTGTAAPSAVPRAALHLELPLSRLSRPAALRLRGGSSSAAMVSNFEEVGSAFVQHYYQIFDSNRGGLQGLYQVCC